MELRRMVTVDNLKTWMNQKETEHLEFKEAKQDFEFQRVVKYCCAISNEGGGHLILGVTDKMPRQIVGSGAFFNVDQLKRDLSLKLNIRVDIYELLPESKRVLIFSVPKRPIGMPIQYEGSYWMRLGEGLVPMLPDMLKRIFDESEPDFSAQICKNAEIGDLDENAVNHFRELWIRKSSNASLKNASMEQILSDTDLLVEGKLTFASLILFGTSMALVKLLPQAEVVFEYRSGNTVGPAQQRIEYRQGFFSFYNDLWEKMNLRNDIQHFQDGLFVWDIPTFNEKVIREAVLNAVSHRDYRAAGSIWVKQYPRRITIANPGGFPLGITPENMLWKQLPRNRRISEVFAKCGLVERAGQGADRIFQESIKEGKSLPDFSQSDQYDVVLVLDGEVQDENFLRFLEKIGQEQLETFTIEDFLVLDKVHRELPIPENPPELKIRLKRLIDLGIIESIGRGKGTRYLLCKNYYSFAGKSAIYTRRKGLDRETNKELLLKHLITNAQSGAKLEELCLVVPSLHKRQVQRLLRELQKLRKVHFKGKTKASVWFPGSQ
jgi:ATP-dependent DNA helicase RecG